MNGDLVFTLVSLAATFAGALLIVVGVVDRKRMAATLEREALDDSAAAAARLAGFSARAGLTLPPGTVAVANREEYQAHERTQRMRAEMLEHDATVMAHADARERTFRGTLAGDLRAGLA